MSTTPTSHRVPALYLSHGAPTLADDPIWPGQLAAWSADLPRPKAILMVSAHWEDAPLALGATTTVPLVYDFWGFPERYYQVRYTAPGTPELAEHVRKLLRAPGTPVQDVPDRGLDHGAYVPLVEMFPDADIPVLQISMPTLDPQRLMAIGRKLAPLREESVLIVGSGFFTHNLRALSRHGRVSSIMAEFDDWGRQALADRDIDALLDFERRAPAAKIAHPRTEHFAPLFVALGAERSSERSSRPVRASGGHPPVPITPLPHGGVGHPGGWYGAGGAPRRWELARGMSAADSRAAGTHGRAHPYCGRACRAVVHRMALLLRR